MLLTDRLCLRPWTLDDLPAMTRINADPAVMRHFPATLTEEETRSFIDRQQSLHEERGHCYFAAETRCDGKLVGFIGLGYQTFPAPFTPAVDIGWRLSPAVWRRGLATEGARACLDYAFDELAVDRIISIAVQQNAPSLRVMEKIGMRRGGTFTNPVLKDYPHLEACVWYEKLASKRGV